MSRFIQVYKDPEALGLSGGWFNKNDKFYTNNEFVVLTRELKTEWGLIIHAAIRNRSNTDINWRSKQRIKNEIFGKERAAIEVFPAVSELVDEANMYHLWILPEGFNLPITLKEHNPAWNG